MESAGSFAAARRDARSGRLGLGFLGLGPFSRENPDFEGWKGLDFLGFSRPNRAFSMGYAGFSLKEISRALLPPHPNRGSGDPRSWAAERDGLVMGQAYCYFCFSAINCCPSVAFRRLHPKATCSSIVIPSASEAIQGNVGRLSTSGDSSLRSRNDGLSRRSTAPRDDESDGPCSTQASPAIEARRNPRASEP
jgi:hypothetical protein